MSRKINLSVCLWLILGAFHFSFAGEIEKAHSISEKQALQIAEQKLVKTYGKGVLDQRPFITSLDQDVWTFTGTMHCPEGEVCKGGVAQIQVSAKNGKVLKLTHGK